MLSSSDLRAAAAVIEDLLWLQNQIEERRGANEVQSHFSSQPATPDDETRLFNKAKKSE